MDRLTGGERPEGMSLSDKIKDIAGDHQVSIFRAPNGSMVTISRNSWLVTEASPVTQVTVEYDIDEGQTKGRIKETVAIGPESAFIGIGAPGHFQGIRDGENTFHFSNCFGEASGWQQATGNIALQDRLAGTVDIILQDAELVHAA